MVCFLLVFLSNGPTKSILRNSRPPRLTFVWCANYPSVCSPFPVYPGAKDCLVLLRLPAVLVSCRNWAKLVFFGLLFPTWPWFASNKGVINSQMGVLRVYTQKQIHMCKGQEGLLLSIWVGLKIGYGAFKIGVFPNFPIRQMSTTSSKAG